MSSDVPSGTAARLFIDTGSSFCRHFGESACGDAIAFRRIPAEERLLAVLADGLGHGLKANILALMTSTMALKFVAEDREIVPSAEIIMDALPVCADRGISYATFTIVDTRLGGKTRVVEMGNPPVLFFQGARREPLEGRTFASPRYRERTMTAYEFDVRPGDRLMIMSDGATQAGTGTPEFPLGWGSDGVAARVADELNFHPEISAHELCELVLREAIAREPRLEPRDDISVACLHYREPKELLLFTGPPFERARDAECARIFRDFPGTRVICGGTSAEIISRELNLPIELDTSTVGGDLPPASRMKGAALVTEGIFTLSRVLRYLRDTARRRDDPAAHLVDLLLRHDVIHFLVGTRVNEAHQNPDLPVELELRRNVVRDIAGELSSRYVKEVTTRLV